MLTNSNREFSPPSPVSNLKLMDINLDLEGRDLGFKPLGMLLRTLYGLPKYLPRKSLSTVRALLYLEDIPLV